MSQPIEEVETGDTVSYVSDSDFEEYEMEVNKFPKRFVVLEHPNLSVELTHEEFNEAAKASKPGKEGFPKVWVNL